MSPALLVRLRPAGPWRAGPDSGDRSRVDAVYHSDSLYSAVTSAMLRLGHLEDWLAATARNPEAPAVRFSSCFPFLDELDFIVPPRTLWPPAASPKVRWKRARFVPVSVISALLAGQQPGEDFWVDGLSECLMPADRPGPFRFSLRSNAAVDRLSGSVEWHATACMEFREDAGLWALAWFADEEQRARWSDPVKAAFRLLADSGFGGERSRGWGRALEPAFTEGMFPDLLIPGHDLGSDQQDRGYWLISLFSPAGSDAIDWQRGDYEITTRGGRIESAAGHGQVKKLVRMITEGSVLFARDTIRGAAPDVAPENFPHPVFRAGFAVSIPLPAAQP